MNILTLTQGNYTVEVRLGDEYVNATSLCQQYYEFTGKRRDINQWLRSKRTQESLQHLSSVSRINVTELVQVFQGGNPQEQGTWIHPHISVRFAVWLSDEFGYAVERCFEQLYRSKKQNDYHKQQIEEMLKRIETIEQRMQQQAKPNTRDPNFIPPGWDEDVWHQLPEQDKQHFRRIYLKRGFNPSDDKLLPGLNSYQHSKENQDIVNSFIIPEEKEYLDALKARLLQIYLDS